MRKTRPDNGCTHKGWHCCKPLPRLPNRGNGNILAGGGRNLRPGWVAAINNQIA